MNQLKGETLNIGFDRGINLEFHGAKVTSDGGLLAHRELDDALGLFDSVSANFHDNRTGRNIQHDIPTVLRQSVYSRLARFILAYNLGNFLRRLALPRKIKHWSLCSLLTRFIKIGTKEVGHSRYVTFQMAVIK